MIRVIGNLNMDLCRVLLAPWMISERRALEKKKKKWRLTDYLYF